MTMEFFDRVACGCVIKAKILLTRIVNPKKLVPEKLVSKRICLFTKGYLLVTLKLVLYYNDYAKDVLFILILARF